MLLLLRDGEWRRGGMGRYSDIAGAQGRRQTVNRPYEVVVTPDGGATWLFRSSPLRGEPGFHTVVLAAPTGLIHLQRVGVGTSLLQSNDRGESWRSIGDVLPHQSLGTIPGPAGHQIGAAPLGGIANSVFVTTGEDVYSCSAN
jgi:hypothetical protein